MKVTMKKHLGHHEMMQAATEFFNPRGIFIEALNYIGIVSYELVAYIDRARAGSHPRRHGSLYRQLLVYMRKTCHVMNAVPTHKGSESSDLFSFIRGTMFQDSSLEMRCWYIDYHACSVNFNMHYYFIIMFSLLLLLSTTLSR